MLGYKQRSTWHLPLSDVNCAQDALLGLLKETCLGFVSLLKLFVDLNNMHYTLLCKYFNRKFILLNSEQRKG